MADGKKKGGRALLANILEGMGELGAQKVGKWLGDFILGLLPAMTAVLGDLAKDNILDFIPYVGSFFLKNEILQDSSEGFLRGLTDALRTKRNEIPDDPAKQKDFFKGLFGPAFDRLKSDIDGKSKKFRGLLMAAAGLNETEQRVLWELVRRSGQMEAVLKVAFNSDITTAELRVILHMPAGEVVTWLLTRLTPPSKPETITDKLLKQVNLAVNWFIAKISEYAKPDSAKLLQLKHRLDQQTIADEIRLTILRNPKMSNEELEALMREHFGATRATLITPPERRAA